MSKGSKRRPAAVSNVTLEANWERAFGGETAEEVRNAERDALTDVLREDGCTPAEIKAILEDRGL